jgi:hypothetical protein
MLSVSEAGASDGSQSMLAAYLASAPAPTSGQNSSAHAGSVLFSEAELDCFSVSSAAEPKWFSEVAAAELEWVSEVAAAELDWVSEIAAAEPEWVSEIAAAELGWFSELAAAEPEWVSEVAAAELDWVSEIAAAEPEWVSEIASAELGWFSELAAAEPEWISVSAAAALSCELPVPGAWFAPVASVLTGCVFWLRGAGCRSVLGICAMRWACSRFCSAWNGTWSTAPIWCTGDISWFCGVSARSKAWEGWAEKLANRTAAVDESIGGCVVGEEWGESLLTFVFG